MSITKRKPFRKTIIPNPKSFARQDSPPPLPPSRWNHFWSLSLTTSAKNRSLQHKVPCRVLFHKYLLNPFSSPTCPLCTSEPDTLDRFLFGRSKKLVVWSLVWPRCFSSSPSSSISSQSAQLSPVPPLWQLPWRHYGKLTGDDGYSIKRPSCLKSSLLKFNAS